MYSITFFLTLICVNICKVYASREVLRFSEKYLFKKKLEKSHKISSEKLTADKICDCFFKNMLLVLCCCRGDFVETDFFRNCMKEAT